MDTSDEWIRTRTGIEERRIASDDMKTSDLSARAALEAIEDAKISPEEIDLIIVATVTPDQSFPSVACVLQERLGAKRAAALDISAACSGFIYAMATAGQFIQTGAYKKFLSLEPKSFRKLRIGMTVQQVFYLGMVPGRLF